MLKWILLITALTLNAGGNLLLKVGAAAACRTNGLGPGYSGFQGMVNLPTLCGLVLFAANVLVYRRALESFAVSVAYPIMVAGSLALVTTAAVTLPILGEKICRQHVVGMALIAVGVWFLSRTSVASV